MDKSQFMQNMAPAESNRATTPKKEKRKITEIVHDLMSIFHCEDPNIGVTSAKALAMCAFDFFNSDEAKEWSDRKFTREDMIAFLRYAGPKNHKKETDKYFITQGGDYFTWDEYLDEFLACQIVNKQLK